MHLDGVSTSPNSFSGPISKEVNDLVSHWQGVKFRPLFFTDAAKRSC